MKLTKNVVYANFLITCNLHSNTLFSFNWSNNLFMFFHSTTSYVTTCSVMSLRVPSYCLTFILISESSISIYVSTISKIFKLVSSRIPFTWSKLLLSISLYISPIYFVGGGLYWYKYSTIDDPVKFLIWYLV